MEYQLTNFYNFWRFDSEYGGQSFGFTSDGESDFVHDDDIIDIDSEDVNNILDRIDVSSLNDVVQMTPNDKKSVDVETAKIETSATDGPKTESVASAKISAHEDEDRALSRTDDVSENSATLVTDSITDQEPTLTLTNSWNVKTFPKLVSIDTIVSLW